MISNRTPTSPIWATFFVISGNEKDYAGVLSGEMRLRPRKREVTLV